MGRSLWKLWLVTTFVWSLFAANLVLPALEHGVFLAHLVNPQYQDEILKIRSTWGLDLLRNMHAILHPSDLISSLQVPVACEDGDIQKNGSCWGAQYRARRSLLKSDSPDTDESNDTSPPATEGLTDQRLVEQQYRAFDKWQHEVPVFTRFGILILAIVVCLRGPLVTLLVGLIAFAIVRISQSQAPEDRPPPASPVSNDVSR